VGVPLRAGEELTEHLRHEKNRVPVDPDAAGAGNIRNGRRPKTVLTDAAGEVSVQVPRDRAASHPKLHA
jgi:putative transposase